MGKVNVVNYKVTDQMKRVFGAGGKRQVMRGRLDFVDVPCAECGGDWRSREPVAGLRRPDIGADGGPIRCPSCENVGNEWLSWLRTIDNMAIPAGVRLGIDLPPDSRLHLSVAHRLRLPSWYELTEARDRLLPDDRHFVMAFPPREFWMNLNEFVLHFYETHDRTLTAAWESQAWSGPTLQEDPEAAYAQMPEAVRRMAEGD